MKSVYWSYDKYGELIPHEYKAGNAALDIKSTLPAGKYKTIDGHLVRVGDPVGPSHYAGSDNLGYGVQGLLNPANGKMYDSRSEYMKAVKESGCVIVGDEAGKRPSKPKTEEINWKAAVAESITQLKQSPTRKGKKK